MKKILTLLSLFQAFVAFSQSGQFFYGAGGKDLIQQIVAAPDGNLFLLGARTDNATQIMLIKITPDTSIIWKKNYPVSAPDVSEYGHNLTFLSDGNMIITGQQRSASGGSQALVMKIDETGNPIWKRIYANTTAAFDVAPDGDNFLVVGWRDTPGSSSEGLVMLINGNGILQWRLGVTVSNQSNVKHIFPTTDGNFLLVGRSNVIGAGYEGVFLRKIAPNGDQIWQVTHNTRYREGENAPPNDEFYSESLGAVQLSDGSIWITNPYNNNVNTDVDIALLHFSSEGELLDEKSYGNDSWREYPYSLTQLPDGGWLIAGTAVNVNVPFETNGFALRVDATGLEVWRKLYIEPNVKERLFSSALTSDGQYWLAGMSNLLSGGDNNNADGWLLKVETDGNILPWKVNGKVVLDTNGDCIANPGEPPAVGWFVAAENNAAHLLLTDGDGNFQLNTGDFSTNFMVKSPDPSVWTICNNGQNVVSSNANPEANLTFVAQQSNGGCALTEVSLTQPDLTRCDTSRFFVTVTNRGIGASDELLLEIELDPALSFVSASEVFTQTGAALSLQLPQIEGLASKIIEVRAKLDCNVQLGASHPVVVTISPYECSTSWTGAFYTVKGYCDGSSVRFELQNTGGGGVGAFTYYRVMADHLLAVNWMSINLPEGANAYVLDFPADGRTWRVELLQAQGYPFKSQPAAAVEGCGVGENGLHSINYLNAWRYDDSSPDVSACLPLNTTGVPNKVVAAVHGFGSKNLHGDLSPLEFIVRARNPLSHPVDKVSFRLTFSQTLDVTTFRPLSYNTPVKISILEDGTINVVMEDLQLDTGSVAGADAFFRFVIHPFPGIVPGTPSLFSVAGEAYFDNYGPFRLAPGSLNYAESYLFEEEEYNDYPPEILIYGGRGFTFGNTIRQAANGAAFLAGSTLTYSDQVNYDGLIIKADANGRAYWLNAIDLGDGEENTFEGVAPLNDGGCLVAGNHNLVGLAGQVNSSTPYIARINASGKLVWYKKIRPAGEQYGAWTNGLVESGDGNFVMFGYTRNATGAGGDHFYIKYDENGNIFWLRHEVNSTLAFEPEKAIRLADGNLVFAGPNNNPIMQTPLYMEKITPSGNTLWTSEPYPVGNSIYQFGIAPSPDGGVLFAGSTFWHIEPGVGAITPLFVKFNANGEFEWDKKPVIGPFLNSEARNIIPAPGGGYLVAGQVHADSLEHRTDMMLLKIDENADTLWWRHYGAKNTEQAEDLIVSAPDQVLIWGFNQNLAPTLDLKSLVVRTDLDGNLAVGAEEQPLHLTHQTLLFPNPANNRANVVLSPQPTRSVDWMLFDVSGRVLERGSSTTGLFPIEVDGLSAGLYIVAFPGSRYPPQRLMVTK